MRITSKGQVTVPKDLRERVGLLPGTEVEFTLEGESVQLRPAPSRGTDLVDHLRLHRGDFAMSTEEIMALTRGED